MTWHRDTKPRERLLARLVPQDNGCWHWTGVVDKQGYGRVGYKGRKSETIQRAVYDCFVGPIPAGLHVDHTCHNADPDCLNTTECMHRRCGNPEHLEPVTRAENTRRNKNSRKTKCKHGHVYTPENTYLNSVGARVCIICWVARYGYPPVKQVAS